MRRDPASPDRSFAADKNWEKLELTRGQQSGSSQLSSKDVVLGFQPVSSLVKVDQSFIQAASLSGSVLLS